MGMFRPDKRRKVPGINTSSLPDLIFTILFFFMIVTNMRNSNPHMPLMYPQGKSLEKNVRAQLSHYIYVGMKDGNEYVQLDDKEIRMSDLESCLIEIVRHTEEDLRPQLSLSLGIDGHMPMGIVEKVRMAIKRCGILHVNYIGKEATAN